MQAVKPPLLPAAATTLWLPPAPAPPRRLLAGDEVAVRRLVARHSTRPPVPIAVQALRHEWFLQAGGSSARRVGVRREPGVEPSQEGDDRPGARALARTICVDHSRRRVITAESGYEKERGGGERSRVRRGRTRGGAARTRPSLDAKHQSRELRWLWPHRGSRTAADTQRSRRGRRKDHDPFCDRPPRLPPIAAKT